MVIFVILVLVAIAIVLSDSANKRKREEEERQEVQKAKADVASVFSYTCRMLEALDILESELKGYSGNLNFYRHIGIDMQTHDSDFEIKYCIINSHRNPAVQEALNSLVPEHGLRTIAKQSGEPLPTRRGSDNYTVWCDLTDEQFDLLYDMITDLNEGLGDYNDIELKGSLWLRFDNPSDYNSYTRRANVYVRALAEAIHAKFPNYGFNANTYGISFNDKNGVVTYEGI